MWWLRLSLRLRELQRDLVAKEIGFSTVRPVVRRDRLEAYPTLRPALAFSADLLAIRVLALNLISRSQLPLT